MAVGYRSIGCRCCQRILAVVSETGLAAEEPEAHGCDRCQRFSALHNAVLDADREWAELQPKRESLKARQNARLHYMQVHMDFDNWLSGVEAAAEPQEGSDAQPQKSTQRARSASPTAEHTDNGTGTSHGLSETQAREQNEIALSLRPSPKRSRSTTSLASRKRLKFSDSVEFRDQYRDCSEYMRSDEKYVRGRYAPPDGSEYLDTSGSAQTFLKFTGVRRVKGDWVEVTETNSESKRKARKTVDDAEKHERPPDDRTQNTPPDPRAMRLARRTRNTLGQEAALARPGKTREASAADDEMGVGGRCGRSG